MTKIKQLNKKNAEMFKPIVSFKETLNPRETLLVDNICTMIHECHKDIMQYWYRFYLGFRYGNESPKNNECLFKVKREQSRGIIVFTSKALFQLDKPVWIDITSASMPSISEEIYRSSMKSQVSPKPKALTPEEIAIEEKRNFEKYLAYLKDIGISDKDIANIAEEERVYKSRKDEHYWEEKKNAARLLITKRKKNKEAEEEYRSSLPQVIILLRQILNYQRLEFLHNIGVFVAKPTPVRLQKYSKEEIEIANKAATFADPSKKRNSYSLLDAMLYYQTCKIANIMDTIYKYETMFNCTIIYSRDEFTSELSNATKINVDTIFNSKWITTNIQLLPRDAISDVLAKYEKVEKR